MTRAPTRIRAFLAFAPVGCIAALSQTAVAQTNGSSAPAPAAETAPARRLSIRVGMSTAASAFLSDARFRKLLDIELQGTALVAGPEPGPLSDPIGWAWIDMPSRSSVSIEVRVNGQTPLRRVISIEAMGSDASARMVAIAGAEMVRSLSRPARAKKPAPGRSPCCEQAEALAHAMPTWAWSGAIGVVWLPGPGWLLTGPAASAGLRYQGNELRLTAAWKGAAPEIGPVSWSELGLAVDHRFPIHHRWRWSLGGVAAASLLRLGGDRVLGTDLNDRTTWSARAAVRLGIEKRLTDNTWIGLGLEPGAILREVRWRQPGGSDSAHGAFLGLDLALTWERRPTLP